MPKPREREREREGERPKSFVVRFDNYYRGIANGISPKSGNCYFSLRNIPRRGARLSEASNYPSLPPSPAG